MAVTAITPFHSGQVGKVATTADLIALVIDEAAAIVTDEFAPGLQAAILTGSMARGESTFIRGPYGWETLGDCEMVLVVQSKHRLPAAAQVANAQKEIERRLELRGLRCPVGLSPVHPRYLESLRPHIYGYELRNCGQVVWGDSRILNLIPSYAARDIPLEDGWRLVCNRMIEQLGFAGADAGPGAEPPTDYRTVKLCLDLATSLLLFCGEYAPTYRERCARLQKLAGNPPAGQGFPFRLQPFADLVQRSTMWKLSPGAPALATDPPLRAMVWDYARRLWRWELLRLTGEVRGVPDFQLMRRWMRAQPLHRRVRGWASVARKHGWRSSWRQWPNWLRLGMRSSPRYCVYAAASELFFQLPDLLSDVTQPEADRSFHAWRQWLPVRPEQNAPPTAPWRQLASEIAWNYRHFLMETSS